MKTLSSFILAAVAAFTMVLSSGCETEAMSDVVVSASPSYANLNRGHSITLTASGGWNYRWSLSDPSAGALSSRTGASVVYQATKNGVTQTITVSGTGNTGGGTTNSTATATYSATATIVQGPDGGGTENSHAEK